MKEVAILSLMVLLVSCQPYRRTAVVSKEPPLAPVYHTTDGRIMTNRNSLVASAEVRRENSTAGYLILKEKNGDVVHAAPFYGYNPRLDWLRVSPQDNLLLFTRDGGGTAGSNLTLYEIHFADYNVSFTNDPPCVHPGARRILDDNYVSDEIETGTNRMGFVEWIRYVVKDYSTSPWHYRTNTVTLREIMH